ncbi:MAG: protein kinase domain-containing protein [Dehalococcoidia bacterium]
MADSFFPATVSHYQVGAKLGGGGMGVVYAGTDRRDGMPVAIKFLYPHLIQIDSTFKERFEREAHIASLLRSPYTVKLVDYGIEGETPFLVMEFAEGESLAEIIRRGPLEPARAMRLARDAARALEEADARGVVHRDIKPENIIVGPNDGVKVADFGIARQGEGGNLTVAASFVGTPGYAAPEQALGRADQRSDIYSLGATLYAMVTGHPPFTGATPQALIDAHRHTPLNEGELSRMPQPVANVIRRCLEKDPLDRYKSPSDLAGALDRAVHTITTQPPGAPLISGSPPAGPLSGSQPSQPPAVPIDPSQPTRTFGSVPPPSAPGGGVPPLAQASAGGAALAETQFASTEAPTTIERSGEQTATAAQPATAEPATVIAAPPPPATVPVAVSAAAGAASAAGAPAPAARSGGVLRKAILIGGGGVVAIAAVFGALAAAGIFDDNGGGGEKPDPTQVAGSPTAAPGGAPAKLTAALKEFPFDLANGSKVGRDDAPLKLVQYEDFQCPFCLRYTVDQEPTLIREYVKTGKLQIEFKHLPILGAESVRAARAGVCTAVQGKFWEFQHRLFLAQAEAGQLENEKTEVGRFSDENLRDHALAAGADGQVFEDCLLAEGSLAAVQANEQEAKGLGISGTPGFTINGKPIGSGAPSTLDGWRKLLDPLLVTAVTPGATATATQAATTAATTAATQAPPATATPVRAVATPVPPTPVPPTPTPSGPPARSIVAGQWTYSFKVTSNTCSFGPSVGQQVDFSFSLDEVGATKDGYISAGETVAITRQGFGFLGNYTFTFPRFIFSWNEQEAAETLTNVYSSAEAGTAGIVESYVYPNPEDCEIRAEE